MKSSYSQSIISLSLSPSINDFLDRELDPTDHFELDGGEHNNSIPEDGVTNEISEAVNPELGGTTSITGCQIFIPE
ncbi:hypothetical protein BGZ79_001491 [Entomortierella chlamydospora]|nr:hypothetical protein BGZ79_001491 [Entomortierella chlamydospora]